MGRVQDRVAVVTGAANGLGQAIATRLVLVSDEAAYITGHTMAVTGGR